MNRAMIKPCLAVHVKCDLDLIVGERVGTVDYLGENGLIKLHDESAEKGKARWIPLALVGGVDENHVYLICDLADFPRFISENDSLN